jgi:ABC-type transport system involved in multi-copper enzyme maturation permease subunit
MALSRGKHRVAIWRFLQLLGAVCLVIVVLTHIAEVFQIFPTMGWGLPNGAGHYFDLVSAILGCTLLPLGFIGSAYTGYKNSN